MQESLIPGAPDEEAVRSLLSPIAVLLLSGLASAATAPAPEVTAFLKEHCVQCHKETKQKGDLRVDNLQVDFTSPKIMGHWEEIMNRINSGDMPPEEKSGRNLKRFREADWIAGQLREAEAVGNRPARTRWPFASFRVKSMRTPSAICSA